MKFLSILPLAVFLLGVSCERHDFEGPEGTKQLHQHHGGGHDDHGHGDDHGHSHGDDHSHDDHGKEAGDDHGKSGH